MTPSDQPSSPDRLIDLLDEGTHEETEAYLDRLSTADADARKRALRAARTVAEEQPNIFEDLADPLSTFLTDEDRAVRLTTAKLFVTLAESEPAALLPAVDALADRLADDEEFYYVRARSAEALGYLALAAPDVVGTPERLADLRVGLAFDEPEVREKLAKALAYVALGDSGRLRYHVDSLADHLDDERDLVRYHLATALVVVGCEHPDELAAGRTALRDRLDDENPYVRGRAAEALGLLAPSASEPVDGVDTVTAGEGDAAGFVADRVAFARGEQTDGVGTVTSVRETVDDAAAAITGPDEDECPHCGLAVPSGPPPMCPRCGGPY